MPYQNLHPAMYSKQSPRIAETPKHKYAVFFLSLKRDRVPVKPSSAAKGTAVLVRQKVATPACTKWGVQHFHLQFITCGWCINAKTEVREKLLIHSESYGASNRVTYPPFTSVNTYPKEATSVKLHWVLNPHQSNQPVPLPQSGCKKKMTRILL